MTEMSYFPPYILFFYVTFSRLWNVTDACATNNLVPQSMKYKYRSVSSGALFDPFKLCSGMTSKQVSKSQDRPVRLISASLFFFCFFRSLYTVKCLFFILRFLPSFCRHISLLGAKQNLPQSSLGLGLLVQRLVLLMDIMIILIINMNKSAFHIAQPLELALERLPDIVRDLERQLGVHDDVDLDVVLLAGVVGAARVDLFDVLVVRHGHVDELGEELARGRLAHQQPDLLKGVGDPRDEDEQADADGADGVEVPHEAGAHHRHDQTKDVDDNVVAMVDLEVVRRMSKGVRVGLSGQSATHEEDMNRRILAIGETIKHQASLGKDRHSHEYDGDQVQFFRVCAFSSSQCSSRLDLRN